MWPFKKKIVSEKQANNNSTFMLNPDEIIAKCGHSTKITDDISAYNEKVTITLPLVKGKTKYCHKCLENKTGRCAWCGKPIFVGDLITLYTPFENFEIPDYAIIYNQDPLQLVGCGRRKCTDTFADYCGFWTPNGVRLKSLITQAATANLGSDTNNDHNNASHIRKRKKYNGRLRKNMKIQR